MVTPPERDQAITQLRRLLRPGTIVYTVRLNSTRSGEWHVLNVIVIRCNTPRSIAGYAAETIGAKYDRKRNGVGIRGCGMDPGFDVVYALSRALFAGRFRCIGENCPSNDHSNEQLTPNYTKGRLHSDGGYALVHRWL